LKNKTKEDQSRVFVPSRRYFLKFSSLTAGGFLLGVNFQSAGPKGGILTFAPNVYISLTARALGIELPKVKINITLLDGGFGRKSKPDFVVEAALLSKASKTPVRVPWT